MEGSAIVAFYRPAAVWRDRLRAYRLVVDGVVHAEIRPDQVVRVPVKPGVHQVQARIDWTGSPPIMIEVGDGCEARFRVEPAGNSFVALFQVFGSTSWLRLSFDGLVQAGPKAVSQ